MNIYKSYKVELKLNNKQKSLFSKYAGTSRFAYNWGLANRIEEYKNTGKSSSAIEQHKQIVKMKKTEEYKWLKEVSKCVPQEALRDLEIAYQNFFRRVKKGENPGFPKFKSKHSGRESFKLGGIVKVFRSEIQLPNIGKVRFKEKNRLPVGTPSMVTCSKHTDKWFVSFLVKEDIDLGEKGGGILGVDLGIKSLAVVSDGRIFKNSNSLKKNLYKLAKLQRQLSRKVKGSNNRRKAKDKIASLHFKISNIRKDTLHKATSSIVKAKTKPEAIVMESLNVSGMIKNHKLARAISDVGFYEFRRQVEYKCLWEGISFILAPRFFPSSKTCNVCGSVNSGLILNDRNWICSNCKSELDRDLNAAINLANYGYKTTESSSGSNACGQTMEFG